MSVSVSGILPVVMPPFPAVLPFPGVPPVAVGFGASIGLPGGGIAGGFTVGPGGVSGGLSGSLGPVSGGLSIGPGGISGGLGGTFGPFSGGISVSPAGLDVNIAGQLGPFGISLNASLPPLLTSDYPGGLFQGPTWGVFDADGQPVAPWDSVIKVDYRHEMKIADFPIEDGAFASYNKVQVPWDMRISFVVGSGAGGVNRRTALLDALEQAVLSLDFYTVATPEATYTRANLTHLEYSRETQRGVNLLVADVWVSEVRPATGAAFTSADAGGQNPQSPTAKDAANSGAVQPIPPTPAETAHAQDVADPASLQAFPDAPQMMLQPMPTLGAADTAPVTPAAMPTESAPLVPAAAALPVIAPPPVVAPPPVPSVPPLFGGNDVIVRPSPRVLY